MIIILFKDNHIFQGYVNQSIVSLSNKYDQKVPPSFLLYAKFKRGVTPVRKCSRDSLLMNFYKVIFFSPCLVNCNVNNMIRRLDVADNSHINSDINPRRPS